MKKIVSCLLLLVIISLVAIAQKRKAKRIKQKENITSVRFETFTRRGTTEVTITKDSAISIGRKESKYVLVTNETWTALLNTVKTIKLAEVPSWPSPTNQRDVDGASHCKIVLITNKGQYESQQFDGGQPMKKLQPLYEKIESIRADIEERGIQYP